MNCHVCQGEGVGHCRYCGQVYCSAHGDEFCVRCTTAVASAGHGVQQGSRMRLPRFDSLRTWAPAEEAAPPEPACYVCGADPQRVCPRCQGQYCNEHAGRAGMCAACTRASWVSLAISGGVLLFIAGLVLLLLFLEK